MPGSTCAFAPTFGARISPTVSGCRCLSRQVRTRVPCTFAGQCVISLPGNKRQHVRLLFPSTRSVCGQHEQFRTVYARAAADTTKHTVQDILLDQTVKVPCFIPDNGTVDVALRVENLGGRRRRVSGGVDIDMGTNRIWSVLTRYDCLYMYMPNITKSDVEKRSGQIFLDQVGVISNKLGWQSRILLRVTEDPTLKTITFSRVEGRDFSYFEGKYFVNELGSNRARLEYELVAVPMPLFPVALVERKIVKEVPSMLASVRQEAIQGNFVPF